MIKEASRILVTLGGIGLGLTVGLSLSRTPARPAAGDMHVASGSNFVEVTLPIAGNERRKDLASADSPLLEQLREALTTSTSVSRWLYWLEAIERAGVSDFPRLLHMAEEDPALLRLIGQRWMKINPRGMFDWVVAQQSNLAGNTRTELERLLLRDWAASNPEGLIQALNEAPAFGLRDRWRSRIARTVIKNDVELGLRLFHQWTIESHGPDMTAVAKWAAQNPRHAAEFALAHPAGYASELVVETIGKEWAKSRPAAALDFAASTGGNLGKRMAEAALQSWAERNLAEAGKWLEAADVPTRNRFSPDFVEAWAKSDPAGALIWCEDNLAGTTLNKAARAVLGGTAENDLPAAARVVLAMKPSAARAEGAVAVAEKWLPLDYDDKPFKPEVIGWLSQLDAGSIRRILAENHVSWGQSDPGSMASFVAGLNDPEINSEVYSSIVHGLVRRDPIEAIKWTEQLPEHARAEAGNEAFNAWREYQPQSAMEWLDSLPTTDLRRDKYFQSAVTEMAKWLNDETARQFSAMAPNHQRAAREVVEKIQLPPDRRRKVLEALGGE